MHHTALSDQGRFSRGLGRSKRKLRLGSGLVNSSVVSKKALKVGVGQHLSPAITPLREAPSRLPVELFGMICIDVTRIEG
ncbi:MAG TPA: hypothetical protein VF414_01390, partial [Thermoanaerobaculia bacterium]